MFGLSGWHVLIILTVLILLAAVVVGIIFLGVFLARRAAPGVPAPAASAPAPSRPESSPAELRAGRLAEIEDLRTTGLLSQSEYEAKRAEILGEI